jgi:flagellar protein FlaG
VVSQINPAGTLPILAAGTSPTPIATRSAPAQAAVAVAQNPGSQEVAVAQVNEHLQQAQTDLKMQMDPSSGRAVFQIVRQGTGDVVLQIPSEEVLGMSRRLRQMEAQTSNTGALVDKKS